jgi:hypothetical protein
MRICIFSKAAKKPRRETILTRQVFLDESKNGGFGRFLADANQATSGLCVLCDLRH